MEALISFLGGSAFRAIWAEVSEWFKRRQEHANEIEMLRLQKEIDEANHARSLELTKLQAELKVEVVRATDDARQNELDGEAFAKAMEFANKKTGYALVDVWNGIIRPSAASLALGLWFYALQSQGFKMSEWDQNLVAVILGFYFAHRVYVSRSR